jgi:hypothetical protein
MHQTMTMILQTDMYSDSCSSIVQLNRAIGEVKRVRPNCLITSRGCVPVCINFDAQAAPPPKKRPNVRRDSLVVSKSWHFPHCSVFLVEEYIILVRSAFRITNFLFPGPFGCNRQNPSTPCFWQINSFLDEKIDTVTCHLS